MPSVCDMKSEKVSPPIEMEPSFKRCLSVVEKKVRNLEKRKGKLDGYQQKVSEGAELIQDQKDALAKYEVVQQNLEFARDMQKILITTHAESEKQIEKQQHKQARRQQIERHHQDVNRMEECLQLQEILECFSSQSVRIDFKNGNHGAVLLSAEELVHLDQFHQLISPKMRRTKGVGKSLNSFADHIVYYLEEKEDEIIGTTYKTLRRLIQKIVDCGYFEREHCNGNAEDCPVQNDSNNEATASTIQMVAEDSTKETSPFLREIVSTLVLEPLSSSSVKMSSTQREALTVLPPPSIIDETKPPIASTIPVAAAIYNPTMSQDFNSSFFPDSSLQPRQKQLQDIVSAMQGNFNFLQESEIDESEHIGTTNITNSAYTYVEPFENVYSVSNAHGVNSIESHPLMMHQQQFSGQLMTLPYGQHIVGDGIYMPHAIPVSYGQHFALTTGAEYNMVDAYNHPLVSHGLNSVIAAQSYYNPSTGGEVVQHEEAELKDSSNLHVDSQMIQNIESIGRKTDETSIDVEEGIESEGNDPKKTFSMNPNANVFKSKKYTDVEGNECQDDVVRHDYYPRGRGRGRRPGRSYNNGYYGRNYSSRDGGNSYIRYPRNDFRQEGYNGYSADSNGWRGQKRERGGNGFNGRGRTQQTTDEENVA